VTGRALIAVVGMVREAKIAERSGLMAVVGAGELDSELARSAIGVLSFGIAGALDPSLKVGALIIAQAVAAGDRRFDADPYWTEALADALPIARRAVLAGSDIIIAEPAARAALRTRTGADAVDTESHLAVVFAHRWGLPFAAVRAISDGAERPLPPAAIVGLGPDGRPALDAVLRSVLRRPGQLPDLLFTALAAERAFRQLRRWGPAIAAALAR
jgi:hopanoid-associated phosphorylase